VNDRGPHSKSFIIDVSQAAAKELGFYGKGVANVVITYEKPEN
jgi:rare lipoprotein A